MATNTIPTPFGREMRCLRRRHGIHARTIAHAIGVSPAYLSNIELGRKPVPDWVAQRVVDAMGLDAHEARELRRASDRSARKVILHARTPAQAELAACIAQRLHEMDSTQLDKLLAALPES